MVKNSGYGSGLNNPDHISERLETICFDVDPRFGIRDGKNSDPGSGMEKNGIHPGSTTLKKGNISGKCFISVRALLKPVLRIRIRRTRTVPMFLGLLDPDPLVRGTDPDPSIIKQNSNLFLMFCDFLS